MRRGRQLDDDRDPLRVILLGEPEERRAHRERVRDRRAIERRERRRLVGPHGLARLVDRVVALARMDAHAAALHLDVDLAELAVEGVVLRHVREHVVVPHVRLDPREAAAQIVRVLDQEPAGLVGQLAEARARVHAQQILVPLEVGHHRAAGFVGAGPPRVELALVVDLVAHLPHAALGAQAHRVHRVDADVGAVGGVDDRRGTVRTRSAESPCLPRRTRCSSARGSMRMPLTTDSSAFVLAKPA